MQVDLTYNEMDSILSVIAATVNSQHDKHATKFSKETIECLREAEEKIEAVFEKTDPEDA